MSNYIKLKEVLDYEQPTNYLVETAHYKDIYKIPVLTAGKSFILGYTNESNNIFPNEKLPVIIFDDFTTNSQYVDFEFKVKSSAMKILKVKGKNDLKYIYYAMKKIKIDNNLHKRYWITVFSEKKIKLPILSEQIKIREILDIIQDLINMKSKNIRLLDELMKSKFDEMFGNPILNNKNWKIEKCLEITTKIGSGATPEGGNQNYKIHGISLIRSMNVYDGYFKYKDLVYIDDEQAKKLNNVTIEKGDILFNITGASVTRTCIVPSEILPARVNQHVSIIRCKEIINNVFLNYMLMYPTYKAYLLKLASGGGGTREAINKKQLENLDIILPPIELQEKFAKIVKQIEEQKRICKDNIKLLQELMDVLMDKFFDN